MTRKKSVTHKPLVVLIEANRQSALSEATTAHVEAILSDQTLVSSADSATKKTKHRTKKKNHSKKKSSNFSLFSLFFFKKKIGEVKVRTIHGCLYHKCEGVSSRASALKKKNVKTKKKKQQKKQFFFFFLLLSDTRTFCSERKKRATINR